MLILNSEPMVLLHLKYKILCAWFLSHHSYSDFIYHVIEIPTSYLNFEIQKLSKEPWSSEIILTNITFRNKGSAFSVSKLKMKHDKNTEKSFLRENKFHTYLTRETLPAEERLGKFHNHGKTPSYQTSADASMKKFWNPTIAPWRNGREGFSSFWDWDRVSLSSSWKLSAVVGKITQTTWRMVQFMEENSIYAKHFGHLNWF